MAPKKPTIVNEDGVWIVQVPKANGTVQEFRCASEQQARHLLAVLSTTDPNSPRSAA